jgi:hypothetical protein
VKVDVGAEGGKPRLAIGVVDVRGVRFVRLDHLLDWLEDYADARDEIAAASGESSCHVDEIRATLVQVRRP